MASCYDKSWTVVIGIDQYRAAGNAVHFGQQAGNGAAKTEIAVHDAARNDAPRS